MAQSFVTTYQNHYRWHKAGRRLSEKPVERFADFFPGEDIWIRNVTEAEGEEETKSTEEAIKMMLKRRMQSVYKVDYCNDQVIKWEPPNSPDPQLGSFENQLLEDCVRLYEPEAKPKIAAPLPTTRKLYGYIRPSKLYVPLTCYQRHHGNVGYKLLRDETKKSRSENGAKDLSKPLEILPCKCRADRRDCC